MLQMRRNGQMEGKNEKEEAPQVEVVEVAKMPQLCPSLCQPRRDLHRIPNLLLVIVSIQNFKLQLSKYLRRKSQLYFYAFKKLHGCLKNIFEGGKGVSFAHARKVIHWKVCFQCAERSTRVVRVWITTELTYMPIMSVRQQHHNLHIVLIDYFAFGYRFINCWRATHLGRYRVAARTQLAYPFMTGLLSNYCWKMDCFSDHACLLSVAVDIYY